MQRRVLALLLLRANRLVTSDRLIEELWGDAPPNSARTTLQTYVYQLRKLFDGRTGGDDAQPADTVELATRNNGYELRIAEGTTVDLMEFERLLARSRVLHAQGLLEDASVSLRTALSYWSGSALADIKAGSLLAAETVRFEEDRKAALETRIDIDLQLGRHYDLVSELTALCMEQPTHEGFAAKLMLALYRCQRRTEALAVYQRLRRDLVAELGLEPSGEVKRLHQTVLDGAVRRLVPRQDPAPARLTTPPSLLPQLDNGVFVEERLRQEALRHLGGKEGVPLPTAGRSRILTVLGPPGSGVTSLTLAAAHELRSVYRDGQFFARIDDARPDTGGVGDILRDFLEACGVPADGLPQTSEGLSAAFKSWSANRRVLVVIDNVSCAMHVRLLQPGGPGSSVIVTGRMRLDGFFGDAVIELAPLSMERCLALLSDAIGAERVEREQTATRRLVTLCDRLPAALRAVAQRLAMRPRWSIARLVTRLSDPAHRLDELGPMGADLVRGVRQSQALLSESGRRALDVIVSRDLVCVDAQALAGLMDIRAQEAQTLLEQLADVYLLIEEQDAATSLGQGALRLRYHLAPLYRLALADAVDRSATSLLAS
ncbi:AfsR/SARP family transcriptional regulator [Streptomyces sp. CA2R101]|uniref:AfsR/SARP family transcriptional regulator n=1 Tax=Streptomyces sp. CA2R101 TaxID=3120152 RepID=UPI0030096B57